MDIQTLKTMVESRSQELFDQLSELIHYDSQNFGSSGREAAVAAYIAEEFTKMGYTPDVFSPEEIPGIRDNPDYWPGHHLENRPCVCCVIPGSRHDRRIMVAAHIDTVPVGDPAFWSVDPFGGVQKDGKIWGRGACDDKYGMAAAMFLVKVFKDAGIVLPYDLVVAGYCDEERGGGNGALAVCLRYPCDDILNLDCKNFEIWASAAGGGEIRTCIRAKDTVDSCGSLLEGLMVVREAFDGFKARREAELEAHPMYHGTNIPGTAVRFMDIHAGNIGADLDRASAVAVYYTTQTWPVIEAELEQMRQEMEKKLAPLGLCFDRYEKVTRFFHFQVMDQTAPLLKTLMDASVESAGRELVPCGSCLSDQSLFLKYGSPKAIAFGLGRDFGVPGGAHQKDEFVECSALAEFTQIIGATLLKA